MRQHETKEVCLGRMEQEAMLHLREATLDERFVEGGE